MGLAGGVHNAKQEKVFERVVFSVSQDDIAEMAVDDVLVGQELLSY